MRLGEKVMKHFSKLLLTILLLPFSTFLFADEHDICLSHSEQTGFIDKTYHYLNTKFCQPAIWFDSFFVDDRIREDVRAGTMIRWYNDFSRSEFGGLKFKSKLNARQIGRAHV